jgi:zinc transport system ATP-binding protein
MALFTCEDAAFAYEGNEVVSGLNFSVNAGDYLCVVGENGSGKSTLIKGLLRLKTPVSGRVLTGEGLTSKDIGYLPQQTAVQKDFPAGALEVVLSGRVASRGWRPFYTKADRRMALENMERLNVRELAWRSYRELSGGQQQRVLLARALCAAKRVLILDEPVAGLDPAATAELYRHIQKLNQETGVTVIMVSHDVRSAARYASHILHLETVQAFFGTAAAYEHSPAGIRFLGGGQDG